MGNFALGSILLHLASLLAVSLVPGPWAWVKASHRIPSAQTDHKSDVAGQEREEVRSLETGKPIERELAGGQGHSFQIALDGGQFLNVTVEQRGIDVLVRLLGPDGKVLSEFDSENRRHGQEVVSHVADAAGSYRLNVQAKEKGAPAGHYAISVVELRAATEKDRALQEARRLVTQSYALDSAGKYDEARPLAERALEIREKTLGRDHPDVAASLTNLANLCYTKGDYGAAEPLYQRALAIRESALGPDHPATASALTNLANLNRAKGDYERAEPLYQRALAVVENALGAEHLDVAPSLNNLANLLYNKGDFNKAEPLYQRALAIWERARGPESREVTTPLNNLAVLYRVKGDLVRASSLYQRALAILEKESGPEHPDVAISLHNLANLYRDQGDYARAEPIYHRALTILEKALGAQHRLVAFTLSNLALMHYRKGDSVKAEPLFQRALAIREKALGPEHSQVALSLDHLALLYYGKGDYVRAEPLYQRALRIWEKSAGPEHPDVATCLQNLAKLYAAKGDPAQAVAFQLRASAVSERNLALNLATGSERQKLVYLSTLSAQADRTISLHLRFAPNDPTALGLAAATILQLKGRVLDATSDGLGTLRRRFNAQDQALLDRLKETNGQLARLVLGGPQRISLAEHQKRIKDLEEQRERLESEISIRSAEFRTQSAPVTLDAVQSAIPENAALVEFFGYRPFNAKYTRSDEQFGAPHYVAYVLWRQGAPRWVELGEAKAIDEAVATWRQALRDPGREDVQRLARRVDEQVMRPVRLLLGNTTRVLISPDGSLNLIPFAALVDERGRYLVERYAFSHLSSGRDLLRLQVLAQSKQGPFIIGDPAFGEMANASPEATRGLGLQPDLKQPRTQGPDLAHVYFRPLPRTAEEARTLKTILPQSRLLTGEHATEGALKQVSGPSILHIATHGFFLKELEADRPNDRGTAPISELQSAGSNFRIENPLLFSGLALAGANQHKSGDDDGVMTALEVAGLDLWGTKLVVLSACDTGVGEIRNGEGVYGLRRALVLAGSESQVISLWPVSDKGTRDLMVAYYTALAKGKGRGEALREVQLKTLTGRNRKHPYYWASFIQSGEWANLEGKR